MQKKGPISATTVTTHVFNYAVTTGSANAYAITLDLVYQATPSLVAGMVVFIKANFTNTNSATLNVNSIGTSAIQKNGAALTGGEIVINNYYQLIYDGTNFQIISCY